MKTHEIKIEKKWYERLKEGQKSFEIRINDRDYQVGDMIKFLVLKQKIEGEKGAFYDRMPETFIIKYVLTSDTCPGLHFGWCILALEALGKPEEELKFKDAEMESHWQNIAARIREMGVSLLKSKHDK